jgi:ABC-2 type transporter
VKSFAAQIGPLAQRSIVRTFRRPVVAFGAFNAITLGTVGIMAALRVGSGQAVAGLFPVFMASMFLSSMNLPRDLIRSGWFRTIATYNPLSYLMEAPRSLLVTGWSAQPLLLGLLVGASIFIPALLSTAASLRALSTLRNRWSPPLGRFELSHSPGSGSSRIVA